MLYADSNMHCSFIFATSICGNWEFSGTHVDINLNIETYEFAVDSTKTDVTAVRAENSISSENIKLLTDDLSLAVSDFYKSVYFESPQISIENISFLNNDRFIGSYGNSLILWQRL